MLTEKHAVRLRIARGSIRLFRARRVRLRPRHSRPWTLPGDAARQRFLRGLAGDAGFEAACGAAGSSRADMLLARARDARFARAWDEVGEARRAAMEMALLDLGQLLLAATAAQGAAALDKGRVALLQAIMQPGRAARPAPTAEAPDAAAAAAARTAAEAEEEAQANALLAQAQARIREAEAAIAAAGVAVESSSAGEPGATP
jgi:pyruvate/2-oxoglutarate dehydrogenase complex dihydrolipoamide acyltransferase (E2) component